MLTPLRSMSPVAYSLATPGAAYGGPTIARVASPATSYTALPTDWLVLLDVSGYGGAGPTINLNVPIDDFLVTIRGDVGQLSLHNATIVAPSGTTIESPIAPGTFASSVTMTKDFASVTYAFDRAKGRYCMWTDLGAATGLVWASDLVGSTNTNQWVAAISGQAGAGGVIPFNASQLLIGASQSGPSFIQQAQQSDLATSTFLFRAQSAFASAVTNTRGGTLLLQGGANQSGNAGLDLGGIKLQLNGALSQTAIECNGGPAGIGAQTRTIGLNYYNTGLTTATVPPTNGDKAVLLADAAGICSGLFSGGIAIQSQTGGLFTVCEAASGQLNSLWQLSPQQSGDTANTQQGQRNLSRRLGRTTTTGQTLTFAFGLATPNAMCLIVNVIGRVAVANTGFVVGDTFGLYRINYAVNVSGTPVQVGTLPAPTVNPSTASVNGSTVTFTFSANTVNVVITAPVSATPPTMDWVAIVETITC